MIPPFSIISYKSNAYLIKTQWNLHYSIKSKPITHLLGKQEMPTLKTLSARVNAAEKRYELATDVKAQNKAQQQFNSHVKNLLIELKTGNHPKWYSTNSEAVKETLKSGLLNKTNTKNVKLYKSAQEAKIRAESRVKRGGGANWKKPTARTVEQEVRSASRYC